MIALLDPSKRNHHSDTPSLNLGDVVIREAVAGVLEELFPDEEIERISSHQFLEKRHHDILKAARLTFIGGSNLLSSHVRNYHQWKLSAKKNFWLFPKINNAVLFGTGWWQYQDDPDFHTKVFYKRVLSSKFKHSVRDSYTKDKLSVCKVRNVLNTSCPTAWVLDGFDGKRSQTSLKDCVFTLTDYNKKPEFDNGLIEVLSEHFSGKLLFFAQGSQDAEYIQSLDAYRKNSARIQILPQLSDFIDSLEPGAVSYVGTRLHGGIKAMKLGVESLILSIDNRAAEIGKDISLPVVPRDDFKKISDWLTGSYDPGTVSIPQDTIREWKSQF